MTQEEYFNQRIEEQIAWYDRAAKRNKRAFQILKAGEIVVASVTPFLIAHSDVDGGPLHVIAAIMSILIAVLAAMLGAFKLQEKWMQFHSVSEQLKHEKYMFLTNSGVYERNSSFPAFVKRIEIILIRENDDWMKLVSAQDSKIDEAVSASKSEKSEDNPPSED
ncbi:MAG: DUF4231 domain-containing protein [Bacteroidota bacterium]